MQLSNILHIRKDRLENLFRLDISKFYLLRKEEVSFMLFFVGIVLSYFCSMNVWFMWSLVGVIPVVSSVFIFAAMLISNSSEHPIFTRRDFLWPTLACMAAMFLIDILAGKNVFGFAVTLFNLFVFFSIFRLDFRYFDRLSTWLAKVLACLLAVSLTAFVLYLIGFNFPGYNTGWRDQYFYTNHYLFLIDDRSIYELIPRFHSVFLEPGHMGTAIVLLLGAQIGKWNRWYNRVMMVALFASFSLAAYCLLVILLFLRMWMMRKRIIVTLVLTIAAIAAVVGGSFVYNDGDNMLNQLIVMRLEVNDTGDDIEGNNRVSDNFDAEFDGYLQSADVFFGRGVYVETGQGGNAGYKVFLYEKGFVAFFLVYLFYLISMQKAPDKRALIATIILSLANFWIRAYPLIYGFYIPYYIMAYLDIRKKPDESTSLMINEQ